MSLIGIILYWVLQVFLWALIGRFFVDVMMSFSRDFKPKGLVLVLAEITMTITDPPLKFFRRFIPNLRFGVAQLDLSFAVVWLAATMLKNYLWVLFPA